VLIGQTHTGRLVVVVHTADDHTIRLISARLATRASAAHTKTNPTTNPMRRDYDFSKAVRGKYAARYAAGTNVVVLDPDVAAKFKSSRAVNDVLRKHLAKPKRGASRRRLIRNGGS
jgi:hypothetical protein